PWGGAGGGRGVWGGGGRRGRLGPRGGGLGRCRGRLGGGGGGRGRSAGQGLQRRPRRRLDRGRSRARLVLGCAGGRLALPLGRLGLRLRRLLALQVAAHLDRRLERARPLAARHATAAARLDERDRELLRAVLEAGEELGARLEPA